jgi:hypothetical protein
MQRANRPEENTPASASSPQGSKLTANLGSLAAMVVITAALLLMGVVEWWFSKP